jgi:hypothetical protein
MASPSPVNLPPLVYKPAPSQSERSGGRVRLVVLHEPVGSYEGTLKYILGGAPVSYHVLTNEACTQVTQLVRWSKKAWSCKAFNSVSDNISIAGTPSRWSFPALNRLARITAKRLEERNLPARFWSAPLRPPPNGTAEGFTFHSQLGIAGGGHTDPRFSATQKAFFIAAVKFHRKFGKFRDTYGRD